MATKKLPKNYWDVIEAFLPNYYSRADVAECNDLDKEIEDGSKSKRKQARLDELNAALYAEALKVRKTACTNRPVVFSQAAINILVSQ